MELHPIAERAITRAAKEHVYTMWFGPTMRASFHESCLQFASMNVLGGYLGYKASIK
jgi:hypothetical protein